MSSDPTKTGVKYIGNDTPFVDALYGSGLKFMPDQTRLVEPELAAKLTRHAEFVDDDTFDYVTATTNLTGGIEFSVPSNEISVENIKDVPDLFFYRRNGNKSSKMEKMINGNHANLNPYAAINGYILHPSVVYIPEKFNGYKYWCAYTPMTNNQSMYENPCIVASSDGDNYVTPAGLTNPIFPYPGGTAFNSDTHLILSPDRKSLILLYRTFAEGSPARHRLKISTSTDGITWSPPTEIWSELQSANLDLASPSLWWDQITSKWYIIGHNFPNSSSSQVRRISSNNLLSGWETSSTVVTFPTPSGRYWWHSHFVRLSGGKIIGLVQDTAVHAAPGDLYFAESLNNGLTWKSSLLDDTWRHYRPSLLVRSINNEIEVYGVYSCTSLDYIAKQRLGITSNPTSNSEDALKIGEMASSFSVLGENVLAVDDFTRPDSSASLGVTLNGATWTQVDPANILGIAANHASNTTTNPCAAVVNVGTSNYSASVAVATLGTEYWLIVGYIDSLNYCKIGRSAASQGKLVFQQIVAGNVATNATLELLVYAGDVIRADVSGHSCNVYLRGELAYRSRNMVVDTAVRVGLMASGVTTTQFKAIGVAPL